MAGLRWVLFIHPSEWAAIPWLKPAIARIVGDEQFHQFANTTGIELRALQKAAVALYRDEKKRESLVFLGTHSGNPAAIEQWLQKRITKNPRRAQDRPDLIRLHGYIGDTAHALALLGRDTFIYQSGGSLQKGPARIAALYAEQKLKRSPTVLAQEPLLSLAQRLGPAPLMALAPGPFEGELARGARGLLRAAVALGMAVRPSAREGLGLFVALSGDFSENAQAAAEELQKSWDELSQSSFGHLLGLDQPITKALCTHSALALGLSVELHPMKLADGLASATSLSVEEMMR